jgi:hypothetical protein
MKQKVITLILLVALVFALVACSSLKLPWTTSSTTTANQTNLTANMAKQPVEEKLALGTLSLEGTDNAVTAEQAKTLLPLWKAVKSLGSDTSASSDEITGLYQQIEEAMTAEQVQVIKDLKPTQEEMQALMKKYGVTGPQGGNMPNLTDDQKATMQARRSSSSSGGTTGGDQGGGPGADGGGMPPDGGGAGGPPGMDAGSAQGTTQQGQANAQGTPAASQQGGRGIRGGGFNIMLADPLIKLLEERAG